MFQRVFGLLKPNVCSLGYALFLAVNATGVWGGVFPFLPLELQTNDVLFWFYFAQSIVLFLVFVLAGIGSIFLKRLPLRSSQRVVGSAAVYFAGWACLIAAIYLPERALPLSVAGGVFMGAGAGLFYLLWQRVFASGDEERGLLNLVSGFVFGALVYAALYLIPRAVTAFLVPLVFLPLFALALILASRKVNYEQPMFSDVPLENLRVYRRAFASMWRTALCMGALAFCAGIVRSVAIERPEIGSTVNLLSMAALFFGALLMFSLWRVKGLRMNITKLYRIVFPVLITAFAVLPFAGFGYGRWFAAGLFALHSIGLMLAMMQSAQMARDRGIGPTFAFGLFGGIIYGLHDFGFIVGRVVGSVPQGSLDATATAALLAIWLLALMFFVGSVDFKGSASRLLYGDTIELLAPVDHGVATAARSAPAAQVPEGRQDNGAHDARDVASGARWRAVRASEEDGVIRDRLDLQIAALREACHISERESEVVGLLARGYTVPRIAEELFISENTVRTHTKRIYAKLDVHKKAELIELVRSF